jgi:arabinan endo-1,5-alpha-L-arabinosidase
MSPVGVVLVWLALAASNRVDASTPLVPTAGWTYYLEAAHPAAWPSCAYRFASYTSACTSMDTWNAAGTNQEWTLVDAGNGLFYLKANCGGYLSVASDCSTNVVDIWSQAGINQQFRFVSSGNSKFELYIEAVGRTASGCDRKYLSFPGSCTSSSPDSIDLWSGAGENQRFRLHPVRSSTFHTQPLGSNFVCPDPFVWQPVKDANSSNYMIQCTGDGIKLGQTSTLDASSGYFKYMGDALGGTPASWASESFGGSRWAPENFESADGAYNYVLFSDTQPDGLHRVGYVASTTGPVINGYDYYSSSYFNLGMAPGGDIDSSIFKDDDGKTYITWKTDDNNVGATSTRIWLQEISFQGLNVNLVGSPAVIMDSTGLWWVDSWVSGGSLAEGPEIVKRNGYYYLFFAAGKFCQSSYTEGVARSTSLYGPYEKMSVPVLSTGLVTYSTNPAGGTGKLIGPGHATIVRKSSDSWSIVWHASIGDNCDRYSFINDLVFGADGWPYVNFNY